MSIIVIFTRLLINYRQRPIDLTVSIIESYIVRLRQQINMSSRYVFYPEPTVLKHLLILACRRNSVFYVSRPFTPTHRHIAWTIDASLRIGHNVQGD
jgi:hypothetical protein